MMPLLWIYGVMITAMEALLTWRARDFHNPPREFVVHRRVVRSSAVLLLLRDATVVTYDVQLALLWALSAWWWRERNQLVRLLAHVANAIACIFVGLSRHSPILLGEAIVLARDALLLLMMVILGARSVQRSREWNFRFPIAFSISGILYSHMIFTAISTVNAEPWVDGGWRTLTVGVILAHDVQTWYRTKTRVSEAGIEIVAV